MASLLPKLARPSLRDQAISVISGRILSGDWSPGTRLPSESELAAQLGVSRSVVRDAVQVLVAWGLLEVRHGVATTVTYPADEIATNAILLTFLRSDMTVGDLLQAREVIDTAVAVAAAHGREPDDCERLKRLLGVMKAEAEAGNWQLALSAHMQFHDALLYATHLPALVTLLRPMHLVVLTTSLIPDVDDVRLYDIPQHETLMEAVISGDTEGAQTAAAQHFAFRDDERYTGLHSRRLAHVSDLVRRVTDPRQGSSFDDDGVESGVTTA